jgi:hypothetical protein
MEEWYTTECCYRVRLQSAHFSCWRCEDPTNRKRRWVWVLQRVARRPVWAAIVEYTVHVRLYVLAIIDIGDAVPLGILKIGRPTCRRLAVLSVVLWASCTRDVGYESIVRRAAGSMIQKQRKLSPPARGPEQAYRLERAGMHCTVVGARGDLWCWMLVSSHWITCRCAHFSDHARARALSLPRNTSRSCEA